MLKYDYIWYMYNNDGYDIESLELKKKNWWHCETSSARTFWGVAANLGGGVHHAGCKIRGFDDQLQREVVQQQDLGGNPWVPINGLKMPQG